MIYNRIVTWTAFAILAMFILELGNVSDFWGRNMKTFLWKSSQRPLIRSGSEWPPYLGLGLGPTKAFPGGGTAAAPTVP